MACKLYRVARARIFVVVLLSGCSTAAVLAEKADKVVETINPMPAPRMEQIWSAAAQSCESLPDPGLALANPVCANLVIRGRQMECSAQRIRQKGITNTYTAPDGLLNWEICVRQIARILADGYYLGNREIERRLQLCDAILDAAPSRPPLGFFSRMFAVEAVTEQSRPSPTEQGLAGREAPVGLLKCEVLLPPSSAPVETTPVTNEPVSNTPPVKTEEVKPAEAVKPKTRTRTKKGATKGSSVGTPDIRTPLKPAGVSQVEGVKIS